MAILPGVQGTVKDSEGAVISGVTVKLYKNGYLQDTGTTDANGYYCVRLDDPIMSPTYVTVKFEKTGYLTKIVGTTAQKNQIVELNANLYTEMGFSGEVVTTTNQPMSGVTVSLIYGGYTRDIDTTDATGNYDVYFVNPITENTNVTIKFEKNGINGTTEATGEEDEMVTVPDFTLGRKLAFFIYDSDVTGVDDEAIDFLTPFGDQLEQDEAFFDVEYYANPSNWESLISTTIDGMEGTEDYVFIHFWAHGGYDLNNGSFIQIQMKEIISTLKLAI